MWYVISFAAVAWFVYRYKKKKKTPEITVSMYVDNGIWEEAKRQKLKSLMNLKKSFRKPENIIAALISTHNSILDFIANIGCSTDEIAASFETIDLPDDLSKKEMSLRKELTKHYKNRENNTSKALSIYLAYKHAELQLTHHDESWKNFLGLQKLKSNLKAEEYFDGLLNLMFAFENAFKNRQVGAQISKDIEKIFEFWNSRNLAGEKFEQNCIAVERAKSASAKHFIILDIIEYLHRRQKFNPKYRDDLVFWCNKDIELYEQFLVEFHEHQLFTADERFKFLGNSDPEARNLASVSIEEVRAVRGYMVPRLNSYDVLWSIYDQEDDQENLEWLKKIAKRIGYGEGAHDSASDAKPKPFLEIDLSAITHTIEVPRSGQKGKLAFLNSKGEACSTEDAFKDHMEQRNWNVMRAEVSFWQAMFCLSFWEEIFDGMDNPVQGFDIPHDLFCGDDFYLDRQVSIDRKFELIGQLDIQSFINNQIRNYRCHWTRLIYNGDQDMIAYFETNIVQSVLKRINAKDFSKIVYRIAQNPSENRSGVSDFVIWNVKNLKMIEVKRIGESIRKSQKAWIAWMIDQSIPNEIVRVKGI